MFSQNLCSVRKAIKGIMYCWSATDVNRCSNSCTSKYSLIFKLKMEFSSVLLFVRMVFDCFINSFTAVFRIPSLLARLCKFEFIRSAFLFAVSHRLPNNKSYLKNILNSFGMEFCRTGLKKNNWKFILDQIQSWIRLIFPFTWLANVYL